MPAGAGATLLGLPRLGLLGLVALGALSQLLIQTQAYGGNPVVLVPSSDAAVLWERAGEIAGGAVVDHMPLDTAPLPSGWPRWCASWAGASRRSARCSPCST